MNFGDIPLKDIKHLLFGQQLNNNIYLQAWNYLLTHPGTMVPKSIANWINLYNFQNRFKDLPDEVLDKIFSEFDYDELVNICGVNKQFNNVCNYYIKPTVKKLLKDKYINIDDNDSVVKLINIYRQTILNNKIILGPDTYVIVRDDGKVIMTEFIEYYDEDTDITTYENKSKIIDGINNAIGLLGSIDKIFILSSEGNVFVYNKHMLTKLALKDIIQMSGNLRMYFLSSDGNVYDEQFNIVLDDIIAMKSNIYNTIFLRKNGDAYGIGANIYGELGLGYKDDVINPTKINTLKDIKNISMSNHLTIALTKDDKLYIFGGNKPKKVLKSDKYLLPILIESPNNIKKIVLNDKYLFVLTEDEHLFIMDNKEVFEDSNTELIELKNMDNIIDISLLNNNLLILNKTGEVFYLKDINSPTKMFAYNDIKLLDDSLLRIGKNLFLLRFENTIELYNI
jgi:hypothetical protein